ncbi:MAG: hypothetical protein JWO60_2346, partial [Frankiales bacterium]|nr:hypothetical protein [Frankiales bacterium]
MPRRRSRTSPFVVLAAGLAVAGLLAGCGTRLEGESLQAARGEGRGGTVLSADGGTDGAGSVDGAGADQGAGAEAGDVAAGPDGTVFGGDAPSTSGDAAGGDTSPGGPAAGPGAPGT